jgi:alpha-tubulin suppressor-like RCC1 family protein
MSETISLCVKHVFIIASMIVLVTATCLGQQVGHVVAWGRNIYGETNVPANISNVVKIASGSVSIQCFATDDHGVVTRWGSTSPAMPAGLSNIAMIAAGENHVVAVKADGTATAWGNNDFGQTNIPANTTGVIAAACGNTYSLLLKSNGTLVSWRLSAPFFPASLSNIVAIAGGFNQAVALAADGTVIVSAPGSTPPGVSNVTAIACGANHTLALRANGTVDAWGNNSYGQCSVPLGLADVIAIAAGGNHSLALKSNRTVVAWGDDAYDLSNPPSGLTNVIQLGAGWFHNLALVGSPLLTAGLTNVLAQAGETITFNVSATAYGNISYQWRFNGAEMLGETNASLVISNVQAGNVGSYSVTLAADGGELTTSAILALVRPPTILVPLQNIYAFAGSNVEFIVAATNEAALTYQWLHDGSVIPNETNSSLGLPNLDLNQAGDYEVLVTSAGGLSTSSTASLFVLPQTPMGLVRAWGGYVTNVPPGLNGVIAVSAGTSHAVALRADGTVVAWGDDSNGATGVPSGLKNVTAISAGNYFNLALKRNGSIVGWGHNFNGQASPPNLDDAIGIATANSASLALRSNGTVVGWGNNFYGVTSIPVGLTNVSAIAAGQGHVLALKHDGTVVGWGANYTPIQGLTNVISIDAGHVNSMALRSDGTVVVWGWNLFGENNSPSNLSNVTAIATDYGRCLALKADRTIVGWQDAPPNSLTNIVVISAGESPSLAVEETGVFIYSHPPSTNVPVGANVNLTVSAIGSSPLTYQWTYNSMVIAGATNSTFALLNVQLAQTGEYAVKVTSILGATESIPGVLVVTPLAITSPSLNESNLFQLHLEGAPGVPYVLQSSSNLVDWISILTNPVPFLYTDFGSPTQQARFFRGYYAP